MKIKNIISKFLSLCLILCFFIGANVCAMDVLDVKNEQKNVKAKNVDVLKYGLPALKKAYGVDFVAKHFETLEALAKVSRENGVDIINSELPALTKKYEINFLDKHFESFLAIARASGPNTGVLLRFFLKFMKESGDNELVKTHFNMIFVIIRTFENDVELTDLFYKSMTVNLDKGDVNFKSFLNSIFKSIIGFEGKKVIQQKLINSLKDKK